MWKFLLFCALAVSVQGTPHVPQVSLAEKKEVIKNLRALLNLRSDSEHAAAGDAATASGGKSSEISAESAEDMNAISQAKTVEDIIKEKYGDLFTTMATDVEDWQEIAEPIAYVIERLNSQRPSIEPCLELAQLVGAVRYAMVSNLQPGIFYTLREALEQAMKETGHVLDLDQALFRNIGHAILKPVFDALEEIECEIGVASDCPASVSAVLPRPSPMEQLFWDTKAYMEKVDFKKTDVGTVIVGILENVWMKVFHEKFTSTYTCERGTGEAALTKLGKAIESLKISSAYDELKSRLGSVISDPVLVNRLADIVIQSHFVTNYQAMRDLKQLLEKSKTEGLGKATSELNGFVLTLTYESIRDEELFDLVLEDVMRVVEAESMNKPVRYTPVEDLIKVSSVVLQSIKRNWKTPCLNARLLGMLAGFVQIQQMGAIESERVTELYLNLVKELGLSTIDANAKSAFSEILDLVLSQPVKPFMTEVLKDVGPQSTELTFFEIQQSLTHRPNSITIKEGVHTLVSTIVPLFKPNEGEHSVFTCQVSNDDLMRIVQQAYGIIQRMNQGTMIGDVKDVLTELSKSSPIEIPQEKIEVLATTLVNDLKREMMNLTSGLAMLEGVTTANVMEKLTSYLAVTLGYSIRYILEHKTYVNEPVSGLGTTDVPTNPAEFVAWQQKLVSDFVSQYMTGMTQYTMMTTNKIDICSAMPQLCPMVSGALPKQYTLTTNKIDICSAMPQLCPMLSGALPKS